MVALLQLVVVVEKYMLLHLLKTGVQALYVKHVSRAAQEQLYLMLRE